MRCRNSITSKLRFIEFRYVPAFFPSPLTVVFRHLLYFHISFSLISTNFSVTSNQKENKYGIKRLYLIYTFEFYRIYLGKISSQLSSLGSPLWSSGQKIRLKMGDALKWSRINLLPTRIIIKSNELDRFKNLPMAIGNVQKFNDAQHSEQFFRPPPSYDTNIKLDVAKIY